jgi:hypothetical protein
LLAAHLLHAGLLQHQLPQRSPRLLQLADDIGELGLAALEHLHQHSRQVGVQVLLHAQQGSLQPRLPVGAVHVARDLAVWGQLGIHHLTHIPCEGTQGQAGAVGGDGEGQDMALYRRHVCCVPPSNHQQQHVYTLQ